MYLTDKVIAMANPLFFHRPVYTQRGIIWSGVYCDLLHRKCCRGWMGLVVS